VLPFAYAFVRPEKASDGADGAVVSTFTVAVTEALLPTLSVPVSVNW
jgi:hypothetical protein